MSNRKQKNPGAPSRGLVLAVLLGLGIAAGNVLAVPQVMSDYGDQMGWRGAEISAMGGTGTAIYRGALSNIYNPALLASETGTRLDLGIALDEQHEDRFQPLFDTFDSWVTDVAIASNRAHAWQTGFGLAGRLFEGPLPVSAAISLTDRYAFDYYFWEELRNPSPYDAVPLRDRLMEEREVDQTGTLRDLSAGFGVQLCERIAFGAAAHYAFGERRTIRSVRDYATDDGDDSWRTDETMDLDGVNFTLGLQAQVNERVEVGLAWESQLYATGDVTGEAFYAATPDTLFLANSDMSYRYPNIFRGGLAFRPRTDPATLFSIELEYIPWDEMADSRYPGYDNPRNLDATTDVRIGLQHTFYNGMPVRFGFRHFNSYLDRDAAASVFSAGTGLSFAEGMLSVSVELSKIESVQNHHFDYPGDYFGDSYSTDPQARVEDTRFRIGLGYTRNF